MNYHGTFTKVLFVLLVALFVLACSMGSLGATATPVPTNTIVPTNTPAPTNTATPMPTATLNPTATLVPTPAPVGEAVRSASYEVTVVEAKELRRVYMGNYYYYPRNGEMFVQLVVKVSNLNGSEAKVPWKKVYVVEESGDSWYPNWAGFQAVGAGKTVDGTSIGVDDTTDGNGTVNFEKDAYLRLIWFLTKKDKTTILFGFDDSPNIKIVVE